MGHPSVTVGANHRARGCTAAIFATAFISSMKTPIPGHLKSVPELFRYIDASRYFIMAILREAYDKGLHLKEVDYCCPPVVMVWEAVNE